MVNLSLMAFRYAIYAIHPAVRAQVIPITALLVTQTQTGICSTTDASFPAPTAIHGIMSLISASYASSTHIVTGGLVLMFVQQCTNIVMIIALAFT